MANTTIYLKDYQPPVFSIESVKLDFDLYDDRAVVTNEMKLQRQHPGELYLHGEDLELISIQMDGQFLSRNAYDFDQGNLKIQTCPDLFTLTIVTQLKPQENTQLSGLYRSNNLFCTQCEAEGFRRITYFPDRPDVLTTYTTRITADKLQFPVLLSNGNLHAWGELNEGRHWVQWHDPFKKPSYLFALVAGNLIKISDQFTTQSGRVVDLHIYVEAGNESKCSHAMQSLKNAMRWDEEQYGREYDLDIYMIVAVSDFNMGAMENKGLNIFNAKYVLALPDRATDLDYAAIEGVVAHEYLHNWTGNRVTCRDWFQLSLKEGLTVFRDQEFSRAMNSRDVVRIFNVKALRNSQFPEDAGRMAHPVRPLSYQEINNFYTATIYNKGAEVIRMQETLLGPEGFRRGMDLYFERHDGQAVTIDDFVAAMEDANQMDLSQFKRWYSQAGTPEVWLTSHYDNGCLTLTLKQSCRPTADCAEKQPFHIPIRMALFDQQGRQLPVANDLLELRDAEQSFQYQGLKSKPVVSLLRGFSAPVILHRDTHQDELLHLLRFETDGFSKWDAAQQLVLNCLTTCYHAPGAEWGIPSELVEAFHQVLIDESLDPCLRADLLTPPGFSDLVLALPEVDVEQLENVRDFFRIELGQALHASAFTLYQTLSQQEDHAMHAAAFSRRKLKNVCLSFIMKGDELTALPLCKQQFSSAETMTDKMASFAGLINCSDEAIRQQAIADFYRDWRHDDLVLDKWFALQAAAEWPDVLEHVRSLMTHPSFNIKNPNKVRALLWSYCQLNPRSFHQTNGMGYSFLTDVILAVDKINPQMSAGLAMPFTRWQCWDKNRQELMKQQLATLTKEKLSNNLQELVTKSLNV